MPKSKKLIKLTVDVGDRAAHDRRRHRRGAISPSSSSADDRHRRQPEAGQADGHRVERHGAGRQPRGRHADRWSPSTSASRRARGSAESPARSTVQSLMLIDSHCHLAGPEFAERPRGGRRAGAARRACTGALVILAADDEPELAQAARRAARCWPEVRFSIGVHPHAAGKFADDPAAAARRSRRGHRRAAAGPRASARSASTTTTTSRRATCSRRSSASRSAWRASCGLPIVIHTREADDDTLPHPRGGAAGDVARRVSLLHRRPRRWRARALDARLPHLARRHRDVSAGARAAGSGARSCRSIGC